MTLNPLSQGSAPSPDDMGLALREKEALYQVTSAIIAHTELADLLQTVVDSVASALPAERVVLITFDLRGQVVQHFVMGGTGAEHVVRVSFDELLSGLSGWVLSQQVPALSPKTLPDERESPEVQLRRSQTRCGDIIVVPLMYQGNILGTMTAINHFDGVPFAQRQVDIMLAMASHTASALTTAEYQAKLLNEIQERRRLENSLAQARDEAMDASRMKSEFLANMSHEIRTPMNAILGLLRILLGTELSAQQLEYVSKTQGAARSLLGLINDILDFSKVESGKLTLEHEPFHLDQLLRNLSVLLSASVGKNSVEVLFDVDERLPDWVKGDALRLQQVLTNLVGNGIKFTPTGQVVLALHQLGRSTDSVTIRFSVQDTGIGIAPEHLNHIFSAFSQAESSTTRRFGGTGLGLAISKRFVELMGGTLQAQSAPEQGSCFEFTLEMTIGSDTARTPNAMATPGLHSQRVLVVDDHPFAGALTERLARSWGWEVNTVPSGSEAVQRITDALKKDSKTFPYTAIFMDSNMPGMDGWAATTRLQQICDERDMGPPIVIMVTSQSEDIQGPRSTTEQASVQGIIAKPFTASMLRDTLIDAQSHRIQVRVAPVSPVKTRRLEGLRILVVEDNKINQQVAEILLRTEGAVITLAANGRLGVEAVAAANPQFDIVMMDIQMPVLDGYGAARAIRDELHLPELPIIAMTANVMASDRAACLAAGMNEHVGKPFDIDQLTSLLLRVTKFEPAPLECPSLNLSTIAEDVPEIKALDTAEAIARMGGNKTLYATVLKEFSRDLDAAVDKWHQISGSGDMRAAAMWLHTLKGNAATLGARELAEKAATLESLYRTDTDVALRPDAIQQLLQTIRLTSVWIGSAQERTPVKSVVDVPEKREVFDKPTVIAALHELAALAQAFDLKILERFQELSAVIESIPGDFAELVQTPLSSLDLAKVRQYCMEKLAELQD